MGAKVKNRLKSAQGPAPSAPTGKQAVRGEPSRLGAHIRQLRNGRGWSLGELSARTAIAPSTLSKVENGALSLNYERLQVVASAFEMSLSEFLAEQESSSTSTADGIARISWANKESAKRIDAGPYDYFYLCTDLRLKHMVPILSHVKATSLAEFGPLLRHDGEEFVFVVKGRVEVHTDFYSPTILGEGEGVYLDSRQGHAYVAAGGAETWILSVNSQTPKV